MNTATANTVLPLVFLSVALLANLLPLHRYPQTVFLNEWWCALAVVCALLAAVPYRTALSARLSAALAAVAVLVLSAAMSVQRESASGLAHGGLILGCWMSCQRSLASSVMHRGEPVTTLAWAVLLAASLQSLAGLVQLGGLTSPAVMVKLYRAIYGNIAQANHFANLLWLGLGSLLYLWSTRRAPGWVLWPLAGLIAAMAALSASRSVWLYTLAIPALAGWFWWRGRDEATARTLRGALVILVIAVVAQFWVTSGIGLEGANTASSVARVTDGSSNGQRLFDWQVAINTALDNPLTGSGTGTFAWQTALASAQLPPTSFVRIGENAHNTVLHVAAEQGLVVAVIVFGLFGWWLIRQLLARPTPERFWALAIIAVIGLHSLVEYPLWYTYFIVPFGLAIGVADAQDEGGRRFEISRYWLLAAAVIGVVMLTWTWRDYRILEKAYASLDNANRDVVALDKAGRQISAYSMFAPHAGVLRIRNWREEDRAGAAAIAPLCLTAARAKPSMQVLEPCVSALAYTGRMADAQLTLDVLCGAYPAIYHADVHARVARLVGQGYELFSCRAEALAAR